MAVSRPRSVPRSKFRTAQILIGAVNGVNTSFTTAEVFVHDLPRLSIAVYFNGQRLLLTDDYSIAESGGPGTGYDTVVTLFAPVPGDKIWADYIAV